MDKRLIINEIKKHYKFKKDNDFANFLGISPQTLGNWKSRNSFDLGVLLHKCLDINPDWITGDSKIMLKPSEAQIIEKADIFTKEDLKQLRKDKKLTQKQFADKYGYSTRTIQKYEKGELSIPVSLEEKITGENENIANDDMPIYGAKINKGVPYYNISIEANIEDLINNETIKPSFYINDPAFPNVDIYINNAGESMEPKIGANDRIGLQKIEDWSFLPSGEIYHIITHTNITTTKRISNSEDEDKLKLVPENLNNIYEIQEISKKIIKSIYKVVVLQKKIV